MAKLATATVFINGNLGELSKALKTAERQTKLSVGNITRALSNIGRGMTIAGLGVLGGIGFMAKGAADFDKAMRNVNSMLLLSQSEFDKLSKDVRALSKDLGVDAVKSAEALYQAISAGVPKENAVEFLRIATKAAIGGAVDAQTAVDGLTTVLNAFKLPATEAERVADILLTTVRTGKTTFGELSASIFQVAPLASSTGVSLEEVAAAMSTLTKNGVPTSVAATQVRASIQGLIRPSEELDKIFQSAGFQSGELALKQIGLQAALDIVAKATGGNIGEMSKLLGSVEGVGAALGITGEGAKVFAADLEAAKNSAGTTQKAMEEQNKGAYRQYEMLVAKIAEMRIELGTKVLPAIIKVFEAIAPLIEKLGRWVEANSHLMPTLLAIGGVLAVGGPLLLGISSLITVVSTIKGLFIALKDVQMASWFSDLIGAAGAGGFAGLASTIGLIVAAAGIGWAIGRWIDKMTADTRFGKWIDSMADGLVNLIEKLKSWMGLNAEADKNAAIKTSFYDNADAATKAKIDARVGKNANGTNFWRGGLTWVGERGRELVNLPRGAQVIPNAQSERMAGGGGVTIGAVHVTTSADDSPAAFLRRFNAAMQLRDARAGA
jgi:TP901 family phage tail tape measure protein